MLKDLITPHNANVFVGKLGDILEKAIDKPLGFAINWGRIWSLWPVHIETACCSVELITTKCFSYLIDIKQRPLQQKLFLKMQ